MADFFDPCVSQEDPAWELLCEQDQVQPTPPPAMPAINDSSTTAVQAPSLARVLRHKGKFIWPSRKPWSRLRTFIVVCAPSNHALHGRLLKRPRFPHIQSQGKPLRQKLLWGLLGSSGFTWIHLDSAGIIWNHLESLGVTWSHLD